MEELDSNSGMQRCGCCHSKLNFTARTIKAVGKMGYIIGPAKGDFHKTRLLLWATFWVLAGMLVIELLQAAL